MWLGCPNDCPKPLEAGDRDQLLTALSHETLPKKRDRALVLLLLSTEARISEILRLDRGDWKSERLWVLGKGDRERVVQVTDKAWAAVEEYLDARADHSPALQPARKECQLKPHYRRRRATRLPPARPATRHPCLPSPPASAHTWDAAARNDG
jgi:site-specific recombinase XerC